MCHNRGVMEPDAHQPSEPRGYRPLGGPVANPESLIELSSYMPSPLRTPDELRERAIADGVLPRNLRGELQNPVVARAALLYLAKHDDVVLQREFEDRFTPLVIEAARGYRAEQEGASTGEVAGELLTVVHRVLTLLDGGIVTAQEAEEALTWPSHLPDIERRATARLLEPPHPEGR